MIPRANRMVALIVCLLALAGCSMLPNSQSQARSDSAPTPTPIPTPIVPAKPTYRVQRGEVVKKIQFTGRIAPVVEQELFFRSSGRVRNVYVKRNEWVTTGQVLADLEIDDLERELTAAQLDLERAQVRLGEAQRKLEANFRRAQVNLQIAKLRLEAAKARSRDSGDPYEVAIKEFEVELAQIALDELNSGVDPLLKNDVARAQLQVDKLKVAIADAQIVAPFDGQVLSITLSEGRAVDAFRPVALVADVSEMEVSADLLSNQLSELVEGMPASVVLVSRPGEEIAGEIRRLPYPYGGGGRTEGLDEDDKSTRVSIEATPEEAGFEMGDLVRVTVVLERKENALWLPPPAVRVFEGRRFVVVQAGDAQQRVDVKLGIKSEDRVEILEGLEEGQVIIGQ